jgi:LysM repeat protein
MATEIYRVKSGESLSIIARDVLGNIERWPELAFINGLSHPYFIYPGQILELPPEEGSDVVEVVSTAPPPTVEADLTIRPATALLLAVGVGLFLWNRSK